MEVKRRKINRNEPEKLLVLAVWGKGRRNILKQLLERRPYFISLSLFLAACCVNPQFCSVISIRRNRRLLGVDQWLSYVQLFLLMGSVTTEIGRKFRYFDTEFNRFRFLRFEFCRWWKKLDIFGPIYDHFWTFWNEIGQKFCHFHNRFNQFAFEWIKFSCYCENWWFSDLIWWFFTYNVVILTQSLQFSSNLTILTITILITLN